jgi:hypothetical protein
MDPDTRQICDLPPGKYTLAIFANDSHYGMSVKPAIYVEEAELSRFDHAWTAYDFDFIPTNNVFVDGKVGDTNPTYPGQAASRDVFYCTTGADPQDPVETKCGVELDDLIYAAPAGVPKPLFLQDHPSSTAFAAMAYTLVHLQTFRIRCLHFACRTFEWY